MSAVEPPRLTPTQRLDAERERQHEIALAVLTRKPAEPTSDIEITRSAVNGRYGFKVAVSAVDALDAERVAGEIADRLEARFPVPSANGGAE